MALNAYITQVQRLLHDPNATFYTTADITAYINEARQQIAAVAQCCRALLPSGIGQNQTVVNQEVYTYASQNALLQATFAGLSQIIAVYSVAGSWGQGMKPMLVYYPWGKFQAYLRSYSIGLQGYPAYWTRYGQGVAGSIYVFPIPSSINAWDWDVAALPIDLTSDADPEAIPSLWTTGIQYYAAARCYQNAQRTSDATKMFGTWMGYLKVARAASQPPTVPNYYPPYA